MVLELRQEQPLVLNIFEMLEFGPIVAGDEEHGVLVTVGDGKYRAWVIEEVREMDVYHCFQTEPLKEGADKWQDALRRCHAEVWLKNLLQQIEIDHIKHSVEKKNE